MVINLWKIPEEEKLRFRLNLNRDSFQSKTEHRNVENDPYPIEPKHLSIEIGEKS